MALPTQLGLGEPVYGEPCGARPLGPDLEHGRPGHSTIEAGVDGTMVSGEETNNLRSEASPQRGEGDFSQNRLIMIKFHNN